MYNIVYKGSDESDSLQHFKYIRRYRKNGKWQYVYNTAKNKLKTGIKEGLEGGSKDMFSPYRNGAEERAEAEDAYRISEMHADTAKKYREYKKTEATTEKSKAAYNSWIKQNQKDANRWAKLGRQYLERAEIKKSLSYKVGYFSGDTIRRAKNLLTGFKNRLRQN